jgi:hypothetical protein
MKNGEISCQLLSKSDIATAVNIVRSSFNDTYLIPSIYRAHGVSRFIELEISNPQSRYYYLCVKNKKGLIGFCEFKTFSKTAFLNIIAIDNNFKSSGFGELLLNFASSFFRSQHFVSITLDVFKTNKLAINWYRNKGMFEIKQRTLSQVKVKRPIIVPKLPELFFINYPHSIIQIQNFGFCMVELLYNNRNYSFGIIKNDLFIWDYSFQTIEVIIQQIIKLYGIDQVYLFADINVNENSCKEEKNMYIDTLIRLEKSIE